MRDNSIKGLATQLQKQIDIHIESFMESHDKLKAISIEIEELEKKMYPIVLELEPVQSLVYNQNPGLERIFESLKRVYGKGDDGIDRETN